MGAQLAASHTPVAYAPPPHTIAVVGDRSGRSRRRTSPPSSPTRLARTGRSPGCASGELAAIDQAERDADRVVLRGGADPEEAWSRTCLRESDLVIAVTAGRPDRRWLAQATALRGCELIVLGARSCERRPWPPCSRARSR